MMVITRLGLIHAIQLKTPLLKRIQVELELILKKPKEPSLESVSNAWVSLRDTLTHMSSMMVTNKTGLTNAMMLKIHGPRRIQVELELTRMKRLEALSQV